MKGINAISNAIYSNSPSWLCTANNESYIILNKDSTSQEVDLFILGLFCYNSITFTDNSKESFRNLIEMFSIDRVILSGGLMFYDGDTKILPSCCAGLEQWAEAVDNISHQNSPWLGHDPYPNIEYKDNSAIVWSDDYLGLFGLPKPKDELQSIEFTNDELNHSIAQLKTDISEFISIPFCSRLKEIDNSIVDSLTSAALKWLGLIKK